MPTTAATIEPITVMRRPIVSNIPAEWSDSAIVSPLKGPSKPKAAAYTILRGPATMAMGSRFAQMTICLSYSMTLVIQAGG